jgi:hypothetical protein
VLVVVGHKSVENLTSIFHVGNRGTHLGLRRGFVPIIHFKDLPKFGAIKLLLAHSCPRPACRIMPNDADISRAPSAPTMLPQDRKGIPGEELSQDSL